MARKKSAQTQVVKTVASEVSATKEVSVDDVMGMVQGTSLIDKVLETPVAPRVPKEAPIPAGYKRLPGGVTRRIRVNKEWIARGVGKPMILMENVEADRWGDETSKDTQYEDIIAEYQCRSLCREQGGGCGGPLTRSVVLETKGPVLVKP